MAPLTRGKVGQAALPAPDLPDIALHSILMRLSSINDFIAFSGVSTSWRSVAKDDKHAYIASRPPLLMLQLGHLHSPPGGACGLHSLPDMRRRETRLPPCAASHRCVSISEGHLITFDFKKPHGRPTLINPFSGAMHTLPALPSGHIRFGVLTSPPASPDCLMLAWDTSTVTLCRPGKGAKWTETKWRHDIPASAVVIEGKVFVLTANDGLVVMDLLRRHPLPELVEIEVVKLRHCMQANSRGFGMEVVVTELGGELLAVHLTLFMAYKLDMEAQQWVKVVSLGGRSLFASESGCIISDDPAAWGGQPNSIYYLKSSKKELMVFSLEKSEMRSLGKVTTDFQHYINSGWVSPCLYY